MLKFREFVRKCCVGGGLLVAGPAVAACVDAGDAAMTAVAAPPPVPGSAGERPGVAPEPVFAADRPCGAATVAVVKSDASTFVFCLRDGVESVGEVAPTEVGSKLEALGVDLSETSAADVFRLVAPGQEVPAVLELNAALVPRHSSISELKATPPLATLSSYCAASGAAAFGSEQCPTANICWAYGPECSYWCVLQPWTWHDRALSSQVGGTGDYAHNRVASCNGTTMMRSFLRSGTSGSWSLLSELTVQNGSLGVWIMNNGTSADRDYRFRTDSNAGAYHYHTGVFYDD
jgi:hypothetical protein